MDKPSIKSIIEELGRGKRTLESRWNTLVKQCNYDRPNFDELKKMGHKYLFPTIELSYKDFEEYTGIEPFIGTIQLYLKEDKEKNLDEFVDVLHSLKGLNNFVSYNCVYQKTLKIIKKGFIQELQGDKNSFDEILDEIIDNILSEIKTYEFFKKLQGIQLVNKSSLDLCDVEIFEFTNIDATGIPLDKIDVEFLEKNYLGRVCVRYRATGEYRYLSEEAMKKFKDVISCLRFVICMYYGDFLYRNQLKIDIAENLLDKSGTAFALNFDDKSFIFSRKMPDASEDFQLSSTMYDDLMSHTLFSDVQRIMLSTNEKSEWERLIGNAIYWCAEAQNEYKIDIAFLKFWTAIETLVSARGEKVTETVLNGTTILYIYGIIDHGKLNFIKVKDELKKLYNKRSDIVHNGKCFDIKREDLSSICGYAVTIILNSIFWSYRGYKKKERIKKYIGLLSKKHGLVKRNYCSQKRKICYPCKITRNYYRRLKNKEYIIPTFKSRNKCLMIIRKRKKRS